MGDKAKSNKKTAQHKAKTSRRNAYPSPKATTSRQLKNLQKKTASKRASGRQTTPSPPISPVPDPQSPSEDRNPGAVDSATAILNALDKSFELSTVVFLDGDRITSKHIVTQLGTFNFQSCLAESIKVVAQRTKHASDIIRWHTGQAELQNSRLTKQNYPISDVFDDDEWKDIEKIVKEWMLQSRPGIRVDLRLYFKLDNSSAPLDPKTPGNTRPEFVSDVSSCANPTVTKAPRVLPYRMTSLTQYRLQRPRNTLMALPSVKRTLHRIISPPFKTAGAVSYHPVEITSIRA